MLIYIKCCFIAHWLCWAWGRTQRKQLGFRFSWSVQCYRGSRYWSYSGVTPILWNCHCVRFHESKFHGTVVHIRRGIWSNSFLSCSLNFFIIIPSFLGSTSFSAMSIFFVCKVWGIYSIVSKKHNKHLLSKYYVWVLFCVVLEMLKAIGHGCFSSQTSKFSWGRNGFIDKSLVTSLIKKTPYLFTFAHLLYDCLKKYLEHKIHSIHFIIIYLWKT